MKPHTGAQPVTRRDALCTMGNGFGMLAFASLVGDSLAAAELVSGQQPDLNGGIHPGRAPNA